MYQIQAYLNSAQCIGTILKWTNGKYDDALNAGSTLSFSVAYDNPYTAYLKRPNFVYLRDPWSQAFNRFRVWKRTPRRELNGTWLDVTAIDMLGQLAYEPLAEYTVDEASATTIEEIVADVLSNYQNMSPQVTLGKIDKSIGTRARAINVSEGSILTLLRQLHGTLPKAEAGFFYVDASGQFQWSRGVGWKFGQVIAPGINCKALRREEDEQGWYNRLYFYGDGSGGTQLNLMDAGETYEYIEDSTSIGANGLQAAKLTDKRIKHATTLLQVAERLLEEHKEPPKRWTVTALDVGKAQETRFEGWHEIYCGSTLRVYDDELSFDDEVDVIRIRRDLGHPLNIEVDLETTPRNLTDTLADIYAKIMPDPPDIYRVAAVADLDGAEDGKIVEIDHEWYGLEVEGGYDRTPPGTATLHRLAQLSDATPQPTGSTASAGTGTAASRDDHEHIAYWVEYTT